MSETERNRWDDRYRDGAYSDRTHPSAFLAANLHELPLGRALDVACGAGRNAICLAAAGFEVDALDISSAGLERAARTARDLGIKVNWFQADFDVDPIGSTLPANNYDVIVMVRYVNPALFDALAKKLNKGGYLLCEQHLRSTQEVVGPRNPRFRVHTNELLHAAANLRVLSYREGLVTDPDGRRAALAQLIACVEPAVFDTIAGQLP